MRHDRALTKPLRKLVRQSLDQPAGVDEHQGCSMGLHEVRHVVQRLAPLLVAGDWAELTLGQPDRQVDLAGVAGVDD